MITLTEEQAQQIEDALRHAAMLIDGQPACNHRIGVCYCKQATALSTIQAARAQEQAEQEPVAWMWRMHGWSITAHGKHRAIKKYVDVCKPPVETQASDDFIDLTPLCAAPVEPVKQEPIIDLSKLLHEDKCCYWDDERFCDCGADSYELLKWYRNNAAPVRTKDLTDDEIDKVLRAQEGNLNEQWFFNYARAVIVAFKEKNK